MAKKIKRGGAGSRYYLAFGVIALLLMSGTLVLVLVVLPQRYILSAGFRESGLSFPNPGVPFVPRDAVQIAARPVPTPTPTPPDEVVRGPAEIFWAQVIPLLESERYAEALPFFERYLLDYPADSDVRRELALTLMAAGRAGEATAVLAGLLRSGEDPELRLLLARTLRDLERVDEAAIHYAILAAASPPTRRWHSSGRRRSLGWRSTPERSASSSLRWSWRPCRYHFASSSPASTTTRTV